MPPPLVYTEAMMLTDVCLSRTSGLSREQIGLGRPRDSDTTFEVKRSRSPGRFGWLYWQANMVIQ